MTSANTSEHPRRFFLMSYAHDRTHPPGMKLLNEDKIKGDQQFFGVPDELQRGFQSCPELPRFLFDAKLGLPVRDLEVFRNYWLISKRTKAVFEAVDPDAFAFQSCEIKMAEGSAGPEHWLCDVTRMIDAVDEAASIVKTKLDRFGRKFYSLVGRSNLIMHESLDPTLHIFRPRYLETFSVCDDVLRDACEAANLTGIGFRDVETIGGSG
jgi:hypothetical protein